MDEQRIHARRWWALGVMCLSLVVTGLDSTILNVALPVLATHLHASTSDLQWMVDGYVLVFAGLLLTTGSLGDRFGRKGALSIGLVIFGAGSLASAFAGSALQLIVTRAFMGIGAAFIMPATLSLLTNVFSDSTERGRAIGAWAAVAGGSGAVGPLLGGLLLRHFWWGSVFLVNVPVVAVALVAGHYLLPSGSKDPAAPALDPFGAILSVAGLVAVLGAIIQGPTNGWSNSKVIAAFVVGAILLIGFAQWELRCSHPMLDVRVFKNRRFTVANIGLTLIFFAMMGQYFLATQYLQSVLGYTPLQAGIRGIPGAVVMLCIAPWAPRIVELVGTKRVMGCGLLLAAAGLGYMSGVPVTHGYPHLITAMCVMSAGMGLVFAPATESIMGSLPPSKAGVGSAMNDTTRQLGGAVGIAVLGSVLATVYGRGVTTSLRHLGVSGDVLSTAKGSVGGAVGIAATLPPALGRQVTSAARVQFVQGFSDAVIVGALVVAAAAVVVFAFLPARALDVRQPVEGPLDGLASLAAAEAEEVLEADAPAPRPDVTTVALAAGDGRADLAEPPATSTSHPVHPPGETTTGPRGAEVAW